MFSLSLLSKKSTIPLAYVMPITLLLVQQVNYKSFLFAAIPFITLAFLLGGVLNSNHIYPFGIVSLIYLITIYIVYNHSKIRTTLNTIVISEKFKVIIAISIQFIIYFFVIWFKQFGFLIINLPIYYFLFKINKPYTIYLICIQALAIDWVLNYHDFGLISLFIAIGFFITTYLNSKLNLATIILLVLTLLIFNYNSQFLVFNAGTILITLLFFFSIERKTIFAIVITIGTIAGAVFFNNIPLLGMLMLLVFAIKYTTKYNLNSLLPIVLTAVMLAVVIYPNLNIKSSQIKPTSNSSNIKPNIITAVNSNNTSEGRSLSFVENSLINESSGEILVFTGLSVLGKYLLLNLFPHQLSFYYGYSVIDVCNIKSPSSWLSLLLYIILIIVAFRNIKKQPILAIGILWYIASITFFSNWVELVAGVVGERLSYNASVGFSIFISGLIFGIKPAFLNKKPFYLELFILLILTLFFLKTVNRNTEWLNPTKLMSSDIKHLSNSAQANNMFGIVLMSEVQKSNDIYEKEQLVNKALFHFLRTISIYPKFFNAHIDISKIYIMQGKLQEARRQLIIAYSIEPKNLLVIEELIKINFDIKNIRALINYTDQYLKYDEKNEKVYELISHLLFENGKTTSASKYAELGLKHFPNNQNLWYIYKNTITSKGN
jgi:tetratricopeptide (TPR) repeat protein